MSSFQLGHNKTAIDAICRGFESLLGIEGRHGGDEAWLKVLVAQLNQRAQTDIAFRYESYGYHFVYEQPLSGTYLEGIRSQFVG